MAGSMAEGNRPRFGIVRQRHAGDAKFELGPFPVTGESGYMAVPFLMEGDFICTGHSLKGLP